MQEVNTDNKGITEAVRYDGVKMIAGFEVNMVVKSHRIPDEVYDKMRAHEEYLITDLATAASFGIHRTRYGAIKRSRTCAPKTLVKIINTLYPNNTTNPQ